MSYKHLTIKEREILMFLRAKGLSIRAVALRLGRNPSTISRELKRCTGNYSPSKADNLSSKAAELSQEAAIRQPVLSPVKLTLIKTKTQFFLSNQIVVIFRHGLVISFSGNELIREVHYSSTNLFL